MEEGHTKLSLSFSNDHSDELVANFKDFMLGAGFLESNIMSAMDAMVQEYEMMKEKTDAKSSLLD